MLTKSLRYYLILTGLLFNLALIYEVYSFANLIRQLGSLPIALSTMAYRVSDIPVLKKVGPYLSDIAQSLDQPSYQWKPFQRESWPMVGPMFSLKATDFDLMDKSTLYVSDSKALLNALKHAQPSNTIVVADGEYQLKGKRFDTSKDIASEDSPILLTAEHPGQVKILMDSAEGIFLNTPYWTVTGFRFSCTTSCDHAIHIVGDAKYTTVSHNEFVDFNAALKINELNGQYPDYGTIDKNDFHFTKPRKTSASVTPINIDHANNWLVTHNIIRDFIKTGGNNVSYGAFMKGGANNGVFENNLVICNTSKTRYAGSQIGLSIGGGGMSDRDRRANAAYEAKNTIIRNNIISHCNDVGIYVNKGLDSLINNNTIYNTSGIDIRFPQSSATVVNNLFSGQLRERDQGKLLTTSGNLIYGRGFLHNNDQLNNVFLSPEIGNFTFKDESIDINKNAVPYPLPSGENVSDFCGNNLKGGETFIGAFSDKKGCFSID